MAESCCVLMRESVDERTSIAGKEKQFKKDSIPPKKTQKKPFPMFSWCEHNLQLRVDLPCFPVLSSKNAFSIVFFPQPEFLSTWEHRRKMCLFSFTQCSYKLSHHPHPPTATGWSGKHDELGTGCLGTWPESCCVTLSKSLTLSIYKVQGGADDLWGLCQAWHPVICRDWLCTWKTSNKWTPWANRLDEPPLPAAWGSQ